MKPPPTPDPEPYVGENRLTAHRLATLDLPVSSLMRAPGEAVGLLALECAMDELAVALNMDPIELRLRNEPEQDPEMKVPFSTRMLVPCNAQGGGNCSGGREAGPDAWKNSGRASGSSAWACRPRSRQPDACPGEAQPCASDREGVATVSIVDDRYRDRLLHDPRPDRGRNAWTADGQNTGRTLATSICRRRPLPLEARSAPEIRPAAPYSTPARRCAGKSSMPLPCRPSGSRIRGRLRQRRTESPRVPSGRSRQKSPLT